MLTTVTFLPSVETTNVPRYARPLTCSGCVVGRNTSGPDCVRACASVGSFIFIAGPSFHVPAGSAVVAPVASRTFAPTEEEIVIVFAVPSRTRTLSTGAAPSSVPG